MSVTPPAECEWHASPEEPVFLVAIKAEPAMLLERDEPLPPVGPRPRGISTTPMSVSALHCHFNLVTGSSPLQYLKRVHLNHARRLMAHDGYDAGTAARAVGYGCCPN
jgi:hypothetical protein